MSDERRCTASRGAGVSLLAASQRYATAGQLRPCDAAQPEFPRRSDGCQAAATLHGQHRHAPTTAAVSVT